MWLQDSVVAKGRTSLVGYGRWVGRPAPPEGYRRNTQGPLLLLGPTPWPGCVIACELIPLRALAILYVDENNLFIHCAGLQRGRTQWRSLRTDWRPPHSR